MPEPTQDRLLPLVWSPGRTQTTRTGLAPGSRDPTETCTFDPDPLKNQRPSGMSFR